MAKSSEQRYEVHNYSHVDRAFREASNRTSHLNKYIARQGLISTVIGIGIFLVCVGLFIALAGWGYHSWKKPSAPIYVEKPIYIPVSQEEQLAKTKSNALATIEILQEKGTESKSDNQPQLEPVYNFTIFKEIPFKSPTVKNITVGMRYGTQSDLVPENQWCYVDRPNKEGVISTVYLARKNGTKLIQHQLTSKMALELGLTKSQLMQAQKLCSFE